MIFAIMGRSGAGKSTIAKKLIDTTRFNEIKTCTTRPMRSGEIDGVDYNFISDEEFEKLRREDMIVAHKYIEARDWHYGIRVKDLERLGMNKLTCENHAVVVVTPDGFDELKKMFGKQIVGILIHSDGKELIKRSILRECDPDVHEICRRFVSDEKDFKNVRYDFKVVNEGDIAVATSHIRGIVRGVLYGSK